MAVAVRFRAKVLKNIQRFALLDVVLGNVFLIFCFFFQILSFEFEECALLLQKKQH